MSDTRERVLSSARQIYLSEGLRSLSMRKVAAEVGVSATAIYRHFENKEAMLISLVAQGSQLFFQYLSRGLAGRTAGERLELSGMAYLDFALDHPSYYRILFMSSQEDIGLERLCAESSESFAPTFQYLVDRVRDCMAEGVLAEADTEATALTIWAGCHGFVSLYLAHNLPMLSEEQLREIYRSSNSSLIRGLG
jgi:AcrR family transcriptional regulator